jgi:hypothetical protein
MCDHRKSEGDAQGAPALAISKMYNAHGDLPAAEFIVPLLTTALHQFRRNLHELTKEDSARISGNNSGAADSADDFALQHASRTIARPY